MVYFEKKINKMAIIFLFFYLCGKSFGLSTFYPPLKQYGSVDFSDSTCMVKPAVLSTTPASITWNTNPTGFGYPASQYSCTGSYVLSITQGSFANSSCQGNFSTLSSPPSNMFTDKIGNLNPGGQSTNFMTNSSNNNCTSTAFLNLNTPPTLNIFAACSLSIGGNLNVTNIPITCSQIGQFAYIADVVNIYRCTVNTTTGALSNCLTTGSGFVNPAGIDITPSGDYAYIADENAFVSVCQVNHFTGDLMNCQSTGVVSGAINIDINSAGTYAYISDNTTSVTRCAVTAGGLNNCVSVGGGSFTGGAWGITTNRAGTYAYATASSVWLCPILSDGTFGTCSTTGSGSPPTAPTVLAFNNAETIAYITNSNNSPAVTKCSVNSVTGALSACADANDPLDGIPVGLFINQSSTFGYVGDFNTGQVTVCQIGAGGTFTSCSLTGDVSFIHAQSILVYANF